MINEIDFRKQFGAKLHSLRKQKGLTQSELALKLNYSDKAVSKWERGESVPDTYTVYKIASFFGVSVDELFSDSLEIKVDPTRDNKTKSVQLFVPLISMFGVFFLASIVFFIMKLVPSWSEFAYYPLIYSVPLASIVMIVFSAIWWNLVLKCVCVSALIWSGAVAIYFSVPIESMKYIFIICIVLQAVCVLSFLFRHFFTKK